MKSSTVLQVLFFHCGGKTTRAWGREIKIGYSHPILELLCVCAAGASASAWRGSYGASGQTRRRRWWRPCAPTPPPRVPPARLGPRGGRGAVRCAANATRPLGERLWDQTRTLQGWRADRPPVGPWSLSAGAVAVRGGGGRAEAAAGSVFVLCFSTLGNWHDLCRRAVAPRRRGRHVILADKPAGGRRPRTRRARAIGGAAAQFDAPRPLGLYPLSARAWRGTHGGTHCRAPRRVTALSTRRHTAAAAACGGGDAPTPPSTGGARRHPRLNLLVLGGKHAPAFGVLPPSYVPVDEGGGRPDGTRPATPPPTAAPLRASASISSRASPSHPPRRDHCRGWSTGSIAANLFFMQRRPFRLVSVQAPAFVCISVLFSKTRPGNGAGNRGTTERTRSNLVAINSRLWHTILPVAGYTPWGRVVSVWFGLPNMNGIQPDSLESWSVQVERNMSKTVLVSRNT